ncbi:MAG: metal ABC transporter ATP-binding protein [Schwartzia sp. (in: firmicutes)]
MAQLFCHDLTIGYGGRPVREALNFSVAEGDYLLLLGENGAGKTTLFKTILGLLPALSGRVEFSDGLSRRDIGYLAQQTAVQRMFPASVREIVRSGCQGRMGLRPFYTRSEKRTAEENMQRLGIAPLADRCYRDLSGGQQQRVLLARALFAARKMLLLDEPVSGLDPKAAADLYTALGDLHRAGLTMLMITHDVEKALDYATHVLFLGEEVFYGTAADYRQRRIFREGATGGTS